MGYDQKWSQLPAAQVRVTETLLSQPPRENSGLVALASVMLVLVVSLLGWRDPQLYDLLSAASHRVFEYREFWRLATAVAVHADMRHFVSNALFFTFFAYLLFGYFGFWVYPVLLVTMGVLTNYLSLLTYPSEVRLVGASGLVYAMAGFWLTIYLLVERTVRPRLRVLRVVGISFLVLLPTSIRPEVSYRSHAIGCVLGITAALILFWLRRDQIRAGETAEWEDPEFDSGSAT